MKNKLSNYIVVCISVFVCFGSCNSAFAARKEASPPDLTAGGERDKKHDWNLGPIGARGWIWGRNLETTGAKQILITKVDKGTPADGVLKKGDVILGVGDRPFRHDARVEFGRAITEAEKEKNEGILKLIRWRDGETSKVHLKIPVMGSYSDMAPYNCAKSKRILEAGCEYIANHMKGGIDGKVNALALLASGEKKYLPIVRKYVRNLGPRDLELKGFGEVGMVSWHWGYTNLLLTEYYLATGDDYVLPAIKEYSVNIAKGQSFVGTWGHGFAWPELNNGKLHGSLGGYGALNQAGLVCHLSLVLAEKCGLKHPEVRKAIEKANDFFGFYIGKGTIPYGDHRPGWKVHDDNGKNSIAAIIFDLQNLEKGAKFFSRMTVASYGERERGHTGNYFSFLWGALGANRAGDEAVAAFLKELRWFYDMNLKWDGSFPYQGGAGMGGGEHKYGGWDCTGAFMLAYALPRRVLYITGKGTHPSNKLTGEKLADTIESGRGFSSWHMGKAKYRDMNQAQLLRKLGSWSPAVRHRAAQVLADTTKDKGNADRVVGHLIKMLNGNDMQARYGACIALGAFNRQSGPAVPDLTRILMQEEDLWLRIRAVYALSHIGKPANSAVPVMLKAAARIDKEDSRQMLQRYLAFGLFYRGGALKMRGIISRDISNVDRQLLYEAVRTLLQNPDGRARGAVGSVYDKLSYDELKPILPAVLHAVKEPAPSGVMFASGIRMKGLNLLAKHRIKEGMPLCIKTMDIEGWGKRYRIKRGLQILRQYGGAAEPVIPLLEDLEKRLKNHREAKRLKPQIELVRETIKYIKSDKNPPELRSIRNL